METQDKITEWRAEYKREMRDYPIDAKVVYLASSYRSARGEYGTCEYIQEAADWARKLWKIGLAVISPVLNTAHFSGEDVPNMVWLLGDFAIIRKCNALVVHPNAMEGSVVTSRGVKVEIEMARSVDIPVFYLPESFGKLCKWAKFGTTPNSELDVMPIDLVHEAGCETWHNTFGMEVAA